MSQHTWRSVCPLEAGIMYGDQTAVVAVSFTIFSCLRLKRRRQPALDAHKGKVGKLAKAFWRNSWHTARTQSTNKCTIHSFLYSSPLQPTGLGHWYYMCDTEKATKLSTQNSEAVKHYSTSHCTLLIVCSDCDVIFSVASKSLHPDKSDIQCWFAHPPHSDIIINVWSVF